MSQLGVVEAAGAADNPRIVQYHAATKGGAAPDAVFWCSSFVNWCWKQCGVEGTRTKRARDWVEKQTPGFLVTQGLEGIRMGDVVVMRRGDDPNAGHVALFLAKGGKNGFSVIGGNQADEVSFERYVTTRAIGYARFVGT
jgi:uncharacterized protein (TIGR02594 family)